MRSLVQALLRRHILAMEYQRLKRMWRLNRNCMYFECDPNVRQFVYRHFLDLMISQDLVRKIGDRMFKYENENDTDFNSPEDAQGYMFKLITILDKYNTQDDFAQGSALFFE